MKIAVQLSIDHWVLIANLLDAQLTERQRALTVHVQSALDEHMWEVGPEASAGFALAEAMDGVLEERKFLGQLWAALHAIDASGVGAERRQRDPFPDDDISEEQMLAQELDEPACEFESSMTSLADRVRA